MEKTQYNMRKAEKRNQLADIDLLPKIPHNGKNLDMAIFGTNTYRNNLEAMQKRYFHHAGLPNISFRPATTSESISAAAYNFGYFAKPEIFDPKWLQAGYIVRTQDGFFTNTKTTDESSLKKLLNGVQKINGVYLLDNGIAFAPYETFERGEQDCDTFVEGGLARALEHTKEKIAKNFREMASPKFYKRGVNVWGFDKVKEPTLRVASLYSSRGIYGDWLSVDGNWDDDDGGFAFGVLDETAEGGSQKN